MTWRPGSRPVISRSIQTSIERCYRRPGGARRGEPAGRPTIVAGCSRCWFTGSTRTSRSRPMPGRGDAGADLYARNDVRLRGRGGRALVPTGLIVAIPPGHAGFVQPRSGLALRHGVTCLNTPGLIDPGYRGELSVLLVNTDPDDDYDIHRGDRIAQLVIQRVEAADFRVTELADLPAAQRGDGGFGHTGR